MTPVEARAYFSQGFVPDHVVAADALVALVAAVRRHGEEVRASTFDSIMLDELAGKKASAWNITLTAGLDSRFVLALLKALPKEAPIGCYTWGPPTSQDVQGAREASGALPHTVLDTRVVEWRRDDIAEYLRSIRPLIGKSYPRLDAVWLYRCLGLLMKGDGPKLNGYLGDMLSGAHLEHARKHDDPALAIASMNATGLLCDFDAPGYYAEFCRAHSGLVDEALKVTNFTIFDLLDYAFRQKQRIEPVMKVDGKHWISPFDSARIIAKWATTTLDERVSQRSYRAALAKYIGKLPPRKARSLPSKIIDRAARRRGKRPTQMKNLADPTVNASLRETMGSACENLDARKVAPFAVAPAFERLLQRPSQQDWAACMFGMSLELHLQAS